MPEAIPPKAERTTTSATTKRRAQKERRSEIMRRTNLKKLPRNRRVHDHATPAATPDVAVSGSGVTTPTTSALFTFSGAVVLSDQTTGITVNAGAPTLLTQMSPTVIKIASASAATLSGKAYAVPTRDPAVRTVGGGYVTAATGTIS